MRTAIALLVVSAAVGGATAKHLTKEGRAELIARAQVWQPTDVASKNLLIGPEGPGAFPPGAMVPCEYVKKKLSGNSPKFACRIGADDEVKVKYGGTNGEVYAEVAATRLLWALGFGADRMYSVAVICHGCPASIAGMRRPDGTTLVDPAAIERKSDGDEISKPIEGWSWKELSLVRPDAGGASREQVDALILLAAFLQHTDSKPSQQRLVCLDEKPTGDGEHTCAMPFLMINDPGLTFGRANFLNHNARGSMNLDAWSATPVWKDPVRCVANISKSYSGTLEDPQVSEAGRRFLAGLLSQLSDMQLHDLFAAARVQLRTRTPDSARSGLATIEEWVEAFKTKRAQIVEQPCGQPTSTSARH